MVERSPEKAGVGGSIPSLATIDIIPFMFEGDFQVCAPDLRAAKKSPQCLKELRRRRFERGPQSAPLLRTMGCIDPSLGHP